MVGIPVWWLLKNGFVPGVGDEMWCSDDGFFTAAKITVSFIKAGMFKDDLKLISFSKESNINYDEIFRLFEQDTGA